MDIFADWIDSSEAASKLAAQRGPISPIVASAGASTSRAPRNAALDEGDEQEAAPRRRFVQEDSDDED